MRDIEGSPGGQGAAVARVKIPVRGARTYLAGLGTSGSLLAGAAVLFLIASAIVAFNGWPQIGVGPATSNISAAPVAAGTRASPRLTAVLATADRLAVSRTAAAGGGVRPSTATHRRTAVQGVRTGSVQTGSTGSSQPTGTSGASAGAPGAAASSPAAAGGQPQQFVSTTTGKVTTTVSHAGSGVTKTVSGVVKAVAGVGNAVGQQITNLTANAGQQVGGAVSQPVGSVISSAGSTVGSSVTGTVNTATNAVNSLTGGLGGLGGH